MATNIYSLVVSYTVAGQFAQNILHHEFDDSGYTDTASAASALINAWNALNTAKLKAIIPTSATITSLKARSLTTGGGFEAVLLIGAGAGSRTGNLSSTAPSPVVVQFPIGNAKPRGRTFLPGVTDTDLVDGEYTTAFRNVINTNAGIWTSTLTLAGGGTPVSTPVIYHRVPGPPAGYIVQYVRLSDTVGQLFRRQKPA